VCSDPASGERGILHTWPKINLGHYSAPDAGGGVRGHIRFTNSLSDLTRDE
jgi:hypothetical protein